MTSLEGGLLLVLVGIAFIGALVGLLVAIIVLGWGPKR